MLTIEELQAGWRTFSKLSAHRQEGVIKQMTTHLEQRGDEKFIPFVKPFLDKYNPKVKAPLYSGLYHFNSKEKPGLSRDFTRFCIENFKAET